MKNDEMHMQTADPAKMMCMDCAFRDRTTIELCGETVLCGVMRDTCMIYDGKAMPHKPLSVVLDNGMCEFYEKDGV